MYFRPLLAPRDSEESIVLAPWLRNKRRREKDLDFSLISCCQCFVLRFVEKVCVLRVVPKS